MKKSILFLLFFYFLTLPYLVFSACVETPTQTATSTSETKAQVIKTARPKLNAAQKFVLKRLEKKITKKIEKQSTKKYFKQPKDWGDEGNIPRSPIMFYSGCVMGGLGLLGVALAFMLAIPSILPVCGLLVLSGLITAICGLFFPEALNILMIFVWIFNGIF